MHAQENSKKFLTILRNEVKVEARVRVGVSVRVRVEQNSEIG